MGKLIQSIQTLARVHRIMAFQPAPNFQHLAVFMCSRLNCSGGADSEGKTSQEVEEVDKCPRAEQRSICSNAAHHQWSQKANRKGCVLHYPAPDVPLTASSGTYRVRHLPEITVRVRIREKSCRIQYETAAIGPPAVPQQKAQIDAIHTLTPGQDTL